MEHEKHFVEAVLPPMSAATLFVVAFALAARRKWNAIREEAARESEPATERLDSPRPQGALLRDALILCVIAMASRDELSSLSGLCSGLLTLAPLAAIDAALFLARSEIPPAVAATSGAGSGNSGR
jgi:hypothetical protein